MKIPYTSLHNHTTGSIGDSLITPKELFETTKELDQSSIAVTDHGSCSALWESYQISKRSNIKLIAGCECFFVNDNKNNDDTTLRHIILLAKNATGYKNLLTINKRGFDNYTISFKKAISRVDWKLLEEFSDGLICTSACGNGVIGQFIMADQYDEAKAAAKRFKDIFGDNFALELQAHNLQIRQCAWSGPVNQQKINLALKKIANELDIRCIVATDAHYVKQEHARAHDVYLCNSSGQPITSGNRLKYDKHEFYMRSADSLYAHFERHMKMWGEDFVHSLFENTEYYAEQCEKPDFIDPAVVTGDKNQLPEFPVKDEPDYNEFLEWQKTSNLYSENLKEDANFYRYRTELGLNKKIKDGKIKEEDRQTCIDQMMEEFDVLEYRNFSSYMLITADFLNWSRENDIPIGPGRGCSVKETLILTDNGYKELAELKGGDQVYTHTGKLQKVVSTFNNGFSNNLVKIRTVYGFGAQTFTKDHLLLALTRDGLNNNKEPKWIEAGKLNKGDLIFSPWITRQESIIPEKIDLAKYIDGLFYKCNYEVFDDFIEIHKTHNVNPLSIKQISRDLNLHFNYVRDYKIGKNNKYKDVIDSFIIKNGKKPEEWVLSRDIVVIPRFIEWNENFCYLLGRWVGDGSYHGVKRNKGITIAFNSADYDGIVRVSKILTDIFGRIYIGNLKNNCSVITVCCELVSKLFHEIFTDYKYNSNSKHFPSCFRRLPDNLLRSLFLGYFDSDGNKTKYGFKFKTVSKQLAMETREGLLYLHCPCGTNVELEPKRNGKITQSSYSTNCSGLFIDRKKECPEIKENGYYCRVMSVEGAKEANTYDIKVKNDSSYLTANYSAHNSVGGSLTAYLNGIHQANPFKYGLIFARFLNKFKADFPDVDNDAAPSGRPYIHEYLRKKYGVNCVAAISNFNTITSKVYSKDISRIFEFGGEGRSKAAEIGNAIADSIPAEFDSVKSALKNAPLFAEYANQYPELKEFSDIIDGLPRSLGTHAAGLVISKSSLEGVTGVRREVDGNLTLEAEKETTHELGYVKIDILVVKTLDIIKDTYDLINANGKILSMSSFDYEIADEKTYNLISSGDTFGVFQLGGTAVHVCKKVQPKNIDDLALISSLVRPAAKDIIPELLKVRDGKAEMQFEHDLLIKPFKNTYGFGLFEESLLILAGEIGWDLHEADKLRKLTKEKGKNPQKVQQWKDEFIRDAVKNKNITTELATEIFCKYVESFSGYGFNKSHATLYSMISFQTAWLKAHYPVHFLLANLKSQVNSNAAVAKDNINKIKSELRAMGVKLVPPDVNTSNLSWQIINDQTLMAGLDSLKFMGSDAIPELIAKRPFTSFQDLINRTEPSKVRANSIQAMAASGSLDCFGMDRKQMYTYASDYRAKLKAHMAKLDKAWAKEYGKENKLTLKKGELEWRDVDGNVIVIPTPPEERVKSHLELFKYPFPEDKPWTLQEMFAFEEYYMGEGISGDKFDHYPKFFDRNKSVPFDAITKMFPYEEKFDDERNNRKANTYYLGNYQIRPLEVVITSVFSFIVKKEDSKIFGQEMARLTVQDPWGTESTLLCFPDAWGNFKERVKMLGKGLVIEAGLAIRFLGNFQWENDHTTSFVLTDVLDVKGPPKLPEDKKAKKVKMPRGKRVVAEEVGEMSKEELMDKLEEEVVDDGLVGVDDEDD